MKLQPLKTLTLLVLAGLVSGAWALEQAKVISSTPVVQQINVPQRVCTNVPVSVQEPKTGAGAVIGAIAGGVIGNAIGKGAGNAAATALGVMGGAVLGDRIENNSTTVGTAQQCSLQYTLSSQVTHYNVVYEYAGKQYSVQMASDPGASLSLDISPAPAVMPPPPPSSMGAGVPPGPIEGMNTAPATYPAPQYMAQPTAVYSAQPLYVNPYPYGTYYAPAYNPYPLAIGIGMGIGFGGYYGTRGRWR
jgi:hypothetical protein